MHHLPPRPRCKPPRADLGEGAASTSVDVDLGEAVAPPLPLDNGRVVGEVSAAAAIAGEEMAVVGRGDDGLEARVPPRPRPMRR